MKKILIARIDDRLIHGQVVTAWIKTYPINHILIVDNELSKNGLMKRIYKAAAPSGVEVSIFDEESALVYLDEPEDTNENLMLLAKVPQVFEKIIRNNCKIDKVILGGMGSKIGRKTFKRNVSANEDEIQSFKNLIAMNVQVVYQMVPADKEIDVKSILD